MIRPDVLILESSSKEAREDRSLSTFEEIFEERVPKVSSPSTGVTLKKFYAGSREGRASLKTRDVDVTLKRFTVYPREGTTKGGGLYVKATTLSPPSYGKKEYHPNTQHVWAWGLRFGKKRSKVMKARIPKGPKSNDDPSSPWYFTPVSPRSTPLRVACTCEDFYYRWTKSNKKAAALYGRHKKLYKPKGTGRPVNPRMVPGLCYHLVNVVEALQQEGVVSRS